MATASKETIDIMEVVKTNAAFRRVVETGDHEQVVVMTIDAGDDIGEEVHEDTDQILIFIEGTGKAELDGRSRSFDQGDLVFVRAGTRHNVINTGRSALKLITVYAPPQHEPGTVHQTKADAERAEH